MNTEMQKKWFVYVQDHHEGPFTVDEVYEKQKSNLVTDESFVWCEGMADWKVITQVTELYRDLQNKKQAPVEKNTPAPPQNVSRPTLEPIKPTPQPLKSEISSFATPENPPKGMGSKLGALLITLIVLAIIGLGTLAGLSRLGNDEIHAKIRPTLNRVLERFPMLAGLLKVTPPLTDVKPEDLKELEASMVGGADSGVKLAIALSRSDPNRPYFYIGSNLPSGTKFDLTLIGNGETLLNKLQFFTQTTVTTNYGFGKSDVILGDGAQPIPKGEYRVYVTESNDQDDAIKNQISQYASVKAQAVPQVPQGTRFLFTKTYFLGGDRDQTYLTRLKAFHDKVKENADKEMLELRQYSETLSSQFTSISAEFTNLLKAKKITPMMRAVWKKTFSMWQQINAQLDTTMQAWTKETLQNEFFYGKAYELVKNSSESLKKLFQLENAYMEKPSDRATFDIEHGKAYGEAREGIELLQSKMNLIINAPKTSSGLPTRDGL